jgi:hypothetical protein
MNHLQPAAIMRILNGLRWLPVFMLAVLLLMTEIPAQAQNTGWTYPQTIPSYDLNMAPPIMVADQNGNVHAFSSQFIEPVQGKIVKVIVYNKWSPMTGWSPPVDILLSPIYEARVTDAFLDDEGYINLVFFGGNGTDADIYFSKAPLGEAANARSWTKPFIIGDEAADPEGAVFAHTDQGRLVVVFYGRQYGNGLYAVTSDDRGGSWSFQTPIYIANPKAPNIFYLHALKGGSGWLHIIWNVFDINGQGRAIYYARSLDGESWDQPISIIETAEGLGAQTPAVVEHEGILYTIYNLPPKIVMQQSEDNGTTWQDPVVLFSRHVGVNGALAPVVDSNNVIHLFFGQRISGSPDIHGMWHSIWENPRWTEPEALIKGPQIADQVGYTSFDPNTTRAVISQGNVILVTWRTDPGLKANGVWYSYIKLDTPGYPVTPANTELSAVPVSTGQSSSPDPTPDELTPAETDNPSRQSSMPAGMIIGYAGLISAVFVVVYYLWKKKRAEG